MCKKMQSRCWLLFALTSFSSDRRETGRAAALTDSIRIWKAASFWKNVSPKDIFDQSDLCFVTSIDELSFMVYRSWILMRRVTLNLSKCCQTTILSLETTLQGLWSAPVVKAYASNFCKLSKLLC